MAQFTKARLGDMLLDEGIITQEQLQDALLEQKEKGGRLEKILIARGYITQDVMMAFLGAQFGIPQVNLLQIGDIPADIVQAVPPVLCVRYCVIPIAKTEHKLTVAMADPLNVFAIDDIKMMSSFEIEPVVASEDEIKALHTKYFGAQGAAAPADKGGTEVKAGDMQEILNTMTMGGADGVEVMGEQEEEIDISKLEAAGSEAPVIRLVNLMMTEAVRAGASDIHIETYEKNMRCRYRIDGVLHEMQAPPKSLSAALSSRIKIMAELDISERRLPQDGRIKIKVLGKEIDLRVSVCPMQFGEKVVMRILDHSNLSLELEKLGFEDQVLPNFVHAITQPYGLVLLTGPTGSGKSTTLYSALNYVNKPILNIATIEDPVEYQMTGINQVEAHSAIGLDFSAGLRCFLRQNADIIMVGEIRDKETAGIAINAALTGLMVFSTLHTNDAPGAVTRLGNMGVVPFLIASTLHCVVGQRLMRRICKECKEPYEADDQSLELLKIKPAAGEKVTIYRGRGCPACSNTGYKGRMAIHEVLILKEGFRKGVLARKSAAELKVIARAEGMQTLRECGVAKVLKGLTSLDELVRVAHEDEDLGGDAPPEIPTEEKQGPIQQA
jgi:type IV pilus assembly protein PilB